MLVAVALLQVNPSIVSKRLVRGELVEPLQPISIVELFRLASDVVVYDLKFWCRITPRVLIKEWQANRPRWPLSARNCEVRTSLSWRSGTCFSCFGA